MALLLPPYGSASGIRLVGNLGRLRVPVLKDRPVDLTLSGGLIEMLSLRPHPRAALGSRFLRRFYSHLCLRNTGLERSLREDFQFSLELWGSHRQMVPVAYVLQPVKVMKLSSYPSHPCLLYPISTCSIGRSKCFYISCSLLFLYVSWLILKRYK